MPFEPSIEWNLVKKKKSVNTYVLKMSLFVIVNDVFFGYEDNMSKYKTELLFAFIK